MNLLPSLGTVTCPGGQYSCIYALILCLFFFSHEAWYLQSSEVLLLAVTKRSLIETCGFICIQVTAGISLCPGLWAFTTVSINVGRMQMLSQLRYFTLQVIPALTWIWAIITCANSSDGAFLLSWEEHLCRWPQCRWFAAAFPSAELWLSQLSKEVRVLMGNKCFVCR